MAEQINPDPNSLPSAEDLQGMTQEQVDQALAGAMAEADTLRESDPASMTDAEVERLEALADFADTVDAETTRRTEEANARAERVAAAQERLARDPEPEEGDGEEEPPADEPAEEDAPAEPTAEDAPQAVAAGATRRPARPAPRRVRQPAAAQRTGATLVAAADIGGRFRAGQDLTDLREVAEAFAQRSKGFPQGIARTPHVRHQHNVATIHRDVPEALRIVDGKPKDTAQFSNAQQVFQAAADESRLTGGSLVAAGGWCAPSETLYGLPNMATQDGIIDLPGVGVDRGGINYTPGPDFSDIFASAGFSQTEAEAIAGTTKPCVEVDCPDFTEVRLDAVGFCVKAPLLTRAAYPEVIASWIEQTLVAVAHKTAARIISSMRTSLGTALAPVLTGTPIAWSTLSILELVIEGQRQAYRLSENDTLEVVAPRWLRGAIRADFANRAGMGVERVTNAMLQEHFADRGAAVQWVLNYLELANPKTVIAYPATVEVMVYPAGTFVRGDADVVNLDTVYDTADLQTNVYTAAFVEDGVLVAKMQHGGARITFPIHITGQMGALNIDNTLGTAQA